MRRWLLALGFCAAIGCGLDVVGALDGATVPGIADAGGEGGAMLPDLDASGDANVDGALGVDATVDSGGVDAEATRPDAGVTFVPSHINPDYTLTAAPVVIDFQGVVDTTARTITMNGGTAMPLPTMVQSGDVVVWSVGSLTVAKNNTLYVVGSRPLVIVSATTVDIDGYLAVYSDRTRPGPGGAAPSTGNGKGIDGTKPAAFASGGGGAGNATAGGAGGPQAPVAGGVGGPIVNANDALLVGGAGGGNGGGVAATVCSDPTRGHGGFGGGALQISAVGKITVSAFGTIDAGGGGGLGGCNGTAPDHLTGGGGGGAGGLVVLESTVGIDLKSGSEIAVGGGAGGEGGTDMNNGQDGQSGLTGGSVASGGSNNGGGPGGNGGYGSVGMAVAPGAGVTGGTGTAAGGGGGAVGRLFLGVRTPATRLVVGSVAALRTDFAF